MTLSAEMCMQSERDHHLLLNDMSASGACTVFVPLEKPFVAMWGIMHDDHRGNLVRFQECWLGLPRQADTQVPHVLRAPC